MLSRFASLSRQFASNRSQRGLWHGKDVRTGNSYCFSHKANKRTFKPNVQLKQYWSELLNRFITISVSSKARRTIEKKGSLDSYITTTEPRDLRSRMGEILREHMLKRQEDPEYHVPYIPHSKKVYPNKRRKRLQYLQNPIWFPPELRFKDLTDLEFDVFKDNPDAAFNKYKMEEVDASEVPEIEPDEEDQDMKEYKQLLKEQKKAAKQKKDDKKAKKEAA